MGTPQREEIHQPPYYTNLHLATKPPKTKNVKNSTNLKVQAEVVVCLRSSPICARNSWFSIWQAMAILGAISWELLLKNPTLFKIMSMNWNVKVQLIPTNIFSPRKICWIMLDPVTLFLRGNSTQIWSSPKAMVKLLSWRNHESPFPGIYTSVSSVFMPLWKSCEASSSAHQLESGCNTHLVPQSSS